MIKLCVVTGSRAELGLLNPVIKRIHEDPDCELRLLATGSHLDTRYGPDPMELEEQGIPMDETIEMNLASDTPRGICKSMGLEMISLPEAYERLKPDMILLLGDRYEIFMAAAAAVICKIPIAHIHGGEITRGAYDDCMRHSITKMSYLHFTSTEEYRQRVIQLGEDPERVFHVGALGIENIKNLRLLTKAELEHALNLSLSAPTALVTYHPATLEPESISGQLEPLLKALDSFPDLFAVFTKSNSDTGGGRINEMIEDYVSRNPLRSAVFTSLGTLRYLSLMSHSQMVIGNSSSGIIEAPFLKVPAVDIGSRQEGRVKPPSVISCGHSVKGIIAAIEQARACDRKKDHGPNPYEGHQPSREILEMIKQAFEKGIQPEKKFYDMDWSRHV
ncbi:UDP-N-acetylglucosamine 2-epimerase [Lachnospiraceae bacterium 54-53]